MVLLLMVISVAVATADDDEKIEPQEPQNLSAMIKILTILNKTIEEEAFCSVVNTSGRDNFITIRLTVNPSLLSTLPLKLVGTIPVQGQRYIFDTPSVSRSFLDKYDMRYVTIVQGGNRAETSYLGYVIEIVYLNSLMSEDAYRYAKRMRFPMYNSRSN